MGIRILLFSALLLSLAACAATLEPTLTDVEQVQTGDDRLVVASPGITSKPKVEVEDKLPSQELDVIAAPTLPPAAPVEPAAAEPAPATAGSSNLPLVIFDTDIGPDVDDVLALAMLHGYQKERKIQIGAVTVSRNSKKGAQYSDAVNTFYGRPDIPIGIYRGGTDKPYVEQSSFLDRASSWTTDVASQPIPDGYRVMRKILADNAGSGRQILIVQTGFAGNTSALIKTGGDDISPKSGVELIKANNTLLVYAGGSLKPSRVEFNIENDISSAQNLFSNWPGRIVLSPFEIGEQILYPYTSIRNDFNWVDRHPVREAYEQRDLSWHEDAPPYYNMRTWDLTAVMQAVEPAANYFPLSKADATFSVKNDGSMTFQHGSGRHQLLDRPGEYSADKRQAIVKRMIELVSARP